MKLPINLDNMTPQMLHRVKLGAAAALTVILAIGTVFGTHAPSGFPETIDGCSIYGSSERDSEAAEANALKNRYSIPGEEEIDQEANLHSLLNIRVKGEDAESDMVDKFDSSKGGRIRGYVQEVSLGVSDSANCKTSDPRYRGTYLYITQGPGVSPRGRILISVTPRMQGLKAKQGIDWSMEALKKYRGRYVEVSGWLFFDEDHWDTSKDNPESEGEIDRATCWSLFPVTDLQEIAPGAAAAKHGKAKVEHHDKDVHAKGKQAHAPASHAKAPEHKAEKPHAVAHAEKPKHAKPVIKAHAKPTAKVKAPVKPKPKQKAKVQPRRAKPRIRTKPPRRKVAKRVRPKAPRRGIVVYH